MGGTVIGLLEKINIGRNRIDSCQNRYPALEDFIICPLADAGKVNGFIKFSSAVGSPVKNPADLTDRNMLLEIRFKETLDSLFRGKAIKSQGNDHFFIERFIDSNELGARKKFFTKNIHGFQRMILHVMKELGSIISQDINIVSGYLILLGDT